MVRRRSTVRFRNGAPQDLACEARSEAHWTALILRCGWELLPYWEESGRSPSAGLCEIPVDAGSRFCFPGPVCGRGSGDWSPMRAATTAAGAVVLPIAALSVASTGPADGESDGRAVL